MDIVNGKQEQKRDIALTGVKGLPYSFPVPEEDDMLFYIQRNQNRNTVVYQLNRGADGLINLENPVNVYWKEYEREGASRPINFLQNKLAYGYDYSVINNTTIELRIVSYPSYKLFITEQDGTYVAMSKFNERWAKLTNIYVYAEEFGAFPNVEFIELYGECTESELPCYMRINIGESE